MSNHTATRPANLRAYRKAEAVLACQLGTARAIVAKFDEFRAYSDVIPEAIGTAWNAAHDAVTALEAEVRAFELAGYGKPVEPTALADLVAANID